MCIDPTVVTLSATPSDMEPEFRRADIAVHTMNLPRAGRRRFIQMAASTYAFCRQHRPDALLSMPLGWHAFLAFGARLAGVRSVAAHAGNYPVNRSVNTFSKFRWLVQAGRPVTTKLICCSSYVQRGVVDQFGVSIAETEVIYNGVDIESIIERSAAARVRTETKLAFVVGMVARYEVHKDQPTLIRAAKLLRDAGRPIEVWLIGDGTRRTEYERLIADLGLAGSVKLYGVRRDIPELLGQLDAFAFAAKPDEGLGIALVEAMAAGVPIVATDVGACREVLDGGNLGVLVPAGDPVALADAIDALRIDRTASVARADLARRKATEVFPIATMAASYARCLRLTNGA